MTSIGPASIATDLVRATAAFARVSLVVQHAPTPPSATQRQIEAGRRAIQEAQAAAEAALRKVHEDRQAIHKGGVIA